MALGCGTDGEGTKPDGSSAEGGGGTAGVGGSATGGRGGSTTGGSATGGSNAGNSGSPSGGAGATGGDASGGRGGSSGNAGSGGASGSQTGGSGGADCAMPGIRVEGRQLVVDCAPYHVRGVCWNPVPRGATHPAGLDYDGLAPTDVPLMQAAGINTVRTYEALADTAVLDRLFAAGIRVL